MHLNPVHFLSLHICPMPLKPPTLIKFRSTKKKKKRGMENLVMEAVVWHCESCIKHFYHTSFLASVHYKESLVWFTFPCLHYIFDAGPLLWLFLDILVPPCIVEILQLWICGSIFFHILQYIRDGLDVGTGQIITLGLGLGYSVGSPGGKWAHSHGLFWGEMAVDVCGNLEKRRPGGGKTTGSDIIYKRRTEEKKSSF